MPKSERVVAESTPAGGCPAVFQHFLEAVDFYRWLWLLIRIPNSFNRRKIGDPISFVISLLARKSQLCNPFSNLVRSFKFYDIHNRDRKWQALSVPQGLVVPLDLHFSKCPPEVPQGEFA